MSSFISQTSIPSEIITTSSSSVSHTTPNRSYMCKFIHEILSLTDHEIERLIQSDNFHLLHDGIQKFYYENKNLKENEINHTFEDFLHKRDFNYIHDTCSYNNKIFVDLFSNLKPDMSWNCTTGSQLNDYSSCPFFFKSIIELKTRKLKTKDYDRIATYLTSILRYSPGRKFIIGCLTNFEETMLIMVLYDDTINQIKYIKQATVTQLTGLQILTLFLSLSDTQLGYNEKFINILLNKKIVFLHYLGRGSSSFVFYCESQQEQLIKFVLKISRQNCTKEKFIIEEMNKIKRKNMNLIQCMDMNFDDDYADYLITFNLRGVKLDKLFMQRFLDDTQLLINTWQQVHLCHKIGYIHSDIRIGNMIMYENMVYIIDYSSAVQPKTPSYYQGCLSTASNGILKILGSNSEKISLYYTDDGISFLKCILLLKPYFQHYTSIIKKAIEDKMTWDILPTYEYAMKLFKDKNIIKTLVFLEENREILSVDDLNNIIIHTLKNEKTDDYHIDEYLQKLKL
ncbi:unnamed protein product [Rotaria sordida]|uniref:Protein kinase domain-containing protein n=1 Tax=Rotaria sordida TaxID=392033 RepID=A0A813SJP6_9BILA|nr:unnamed protein product [Rotaria sordida]